MSYENRQVPEGINVTQEHPLREFLWLSAAAIGLVVVLVAAISLSAEFLAPYVPFEMEKALGQGVADNFVDAVPEDPRHQSIERYLQSLSHRLAAVQGLPQNIQVTVHYADSDVVNAMATLGAHIVIYRGLLEKMPHENALSMVLAHEIAHIKHRDPLIALGRGAIGLILISALTGFGDSALLDGLIGQTGMITTLKFNRDQETSADLEAMKTVERYYGHLLGANALFEILQAEDGGIDSPEFLRSHPLSSERIRRIKAYQDAHSRNEVPDLTELPKIIQEIRVISSADPDSPTPKI